MYFWYEFILDLPLNNGRWTCDILRDLRAIMNGDTNCFIGNYKKIFGRPFQKEPT